MKLFDKFLVVFIVVAIGVGAYFIYFKNAFRSNTTTASNTITPTVTIPEEQVDAEPAPKPETKNSIKQSVALAVPFTAQAPTANWDELHNEACEEASAIMANAYFSGVTTSTLSANDVEAQIANLTEWQKENQGYYLDQTSIETAKMIEDVYGLNAEVLPSFTEQDLKQALSDGKLLILSASGQLLNNPNFKQPGPIHHMFVITGYDAEGFIVNDPGTRRGQNFRYTYATLRSAAADWIHSRETTDTSKKPIIVVSK